MANHSRKIRIDGSWFRWVYCQLGTSMNSLANITGWSARQIRASVKEGMMTPELLNACAKGLGVNPDYLAGKYNWTLSIEIMEDPGVKEYWLGEIMQPSRHPYLQSVQARTSYSDLQRDMLLLHGVGQEVYKALDKEHRQKLDVGLDRAITHVLQHYFPTAHQDESSMRTFDDTFQDESDVIEFMLDWLVEHGKAKIEVREEPQPHQ